MGNFLYIFVYLYFVWILRIVVSESAGELKVVTRCAWTSFDSRLCPVDRISDIASIYVGHTADPIRCNVREPVCAVEMTAGNFPKAHRDVLEHCDGLSACKPMFPPGVSVVCDGESYISNYLSIQYKCVESKRALLYHTLHTGDYFHKALCPLGLHISVYQLYFGKSTNSSSAHCTPCTEDLLYASPRQDLLVYTRQNCEGRLACTDVQAVQDRLRFGLSDYMVLQYHCTGAVSDDLKTVNIPFEKYFDSGLCPLDSRIVTLEAYTIANRSELRTAGILATDCVASYSIEAEIKQRCDGHVACVNIRIGGVMMRCGRGLVSAEFVTLLYRCERIRDVAVYSSVSCADGNSQTIQCPDNIVSVSQAFFGYTDSGQCPLKPSYEIRDCLRTIQSQLGRDGYRSFKDKCASKEVCEVSPPTIANRQCNNETHDRNTYFVVTYHCQTRIRILRACEDDNIDITCSTDNRIHIVSATYNKFTSMSRVVCSDVLSRPPDAYTCVLMLSNDSIYYNQLLDLCQEKRVCGPLIVQDLSPGCHFQSLHGLGVMEIQYFCAPVRPNTTHHTRDDFIMADSLSTLIHVMLGMLAVFSVIVITTVIYACRRKRRQRKYEVTAKDKRVSEDTSFDDEDCITIFDSTSTNLNQIENGTGDIGEVTYMNTNAHRKTNNYENSNITMPNFYENGGIRNSNGNRKEVSRRTNGDQSRISVGIVSTSSEDNRSDFVRDNTRQVDIDVYTEVRKHRPISEMGSTVLVDNAIYERSNYHTGHV